jgi:antitoxin MazE
MYQLSGAAMESVVHKWGNSAAVRLPALLLKEVHLSTGALIEITAENGRIVIAPVRGKYKLEDLLAGVTEENRHEEADFGPPVGHEAL